MDDNDFSTNLLKKATQNLKSVEAPDYFAMDSNGLKTTNTEYFDHIKRLHNMRPENEINLFGGRYRFGVFDPYHDLKNGKEFLFFTKPDLHIISIDDDTGAVSTNELNPDLANNPFFIDLYKRYRKVILCLQASVNNLSGLGGTCSTYGEQMFNDPFNYLLANCITSNLTVPSLEADTIETASNMYGVNMSYRGSSENSNDNFTFDLEFKDTKQLYVYQFFRAYEEYETLKHHGTIRPYIKYITDKVLHDQFSIYKFLVGEDMETIIYYGKYYGVMPTSLPRDVFTNDSFEDGLSYTISFKAAFYEDMNPNILADFNKLSSYRYDKALYEIGTYNEVFDVTDNRPAQFAKVFRDSNTTLYSNEPGGFVYKLKWKGNDRY